MESYVCTFCDKSFSSVTQYCQHLESHYEIKDPDPTENLSGASTGNDLVEENPKDIVFKVLDNNISSEDIDTVWEAKQSTLKSVEDSAAVDFTTHSGRESQPCKNCGKPIPFHPENYEKTLREITQHVCDYSLSLRKSGNSIQDRKYFQEISYQGHRKTLREIESLATGSDISKPKSDLNPEANGTNPSKEMQEWIFEEAQNQNSKHVGPSSTSRDESHSHVAHILESKSGQKQNSKSDVKSSTVSPNILTIYGSSLDNAKAASDKKVTDLKRVMAAQENKRNTFPCSICRVVFIDSMHRNQHEKFHQAGVKYSIHGKRQEIPSTFEISGRPYSYKDETAKPKSLTDLNKTLVDQVSSADKTVVAQLAREAIENSNEGRLTILEICDHIRRVENPSSTNNDRWLDSNLWKTVYAILSENTEMFVSVNEKGCVWWKIARNGNPSETEFVVDSKGFGEDVNEEVIDELFDEVSDSNFANQFDRAVGHNEAALTAIREIDPNFWDPRDTNTQKVIAKTNKKESVVSNQVAPNDLESLLDSGNVSSCMNSETLTFENTTYQATSENLENYQVSSENLGHLAEDVELTREEFTVIPSENTADHQDLSLDISKADLNLLATNSTQQSLREEELTKELVNRAGLQKWETASQSYSCTFCGMKFPSLDDKKGHWSNCQYRVQESINMDCRVLYDERKAKKRKIDTERRLETLSYAGFQNSIPPHKKILTSLPKKKMTPKMRYSKKSNTILCKNCKLKFYNNSSYKGHLTLCEKLVRYRLKVKEQKRDLIGKEKPVEITIED